MTERVMKEFKLFAQYLWMVNGNGYGLAIGLGMLIGYWMHP